MLEIITVGLILLSMAFGDKLAETLSILVPPWLKKILAVACVLLSIRLFSMALEPNPATTGEIEDIVNTAVDIFMFIASIFLFFAGVVTWFGTPTEDMSSSAEQQPHLNFEIKR